MNTSYLPAGIYQSLVADLACTLSTYHDAPAARLHAVTDALARHGYDLPELAQVLADAEPWPYVEAFDLDQVKFILSEEADLWPETIRPDVEQVETDHRRSRATDPIQAQHASFHAPNNISNIS